MGAVIAGNTITASVKHFQGPFIKARLTASAPPLLFCLVSFPHDPPHVRASG